MLNIPAFFDQARRMLFGATPPAPDHKPVAASPAADDSDLTRWAMLEAASFIYTGPATQQPVLATLTPAYAKTRAGHRARRLTVPGTDIQALVAPDFASGRPRVLAVFSRRQWVHPHQFRVQA